PPLPCQKWVQFVGPDPSGYVPMGPTDAPDFGPPPTRRSAWISDQTTSHCAEAWTCPGASPELPPPPVCARATPDAPSAIETAVAVTSRRFISPPFSVQFGSSFRRCHRAPSHTAREG